MATFPGGVANLPTPADTDVLGTGASMGGSTTLADLLDEYAAEIVATQTWLRQGPVYTLASSGAACTLQDPGANPYQRVTFTAACTVTMPTPVAGTGFALQAIQGTGGFTATFTGVLWTGGSSHAPVLSPGAGALDIYTFVCFATHWCGGIFGQGMA